jgi:hypothetical protein
VEGAKPKRSAPLEHLEHQEAGVQRRDDHDEDGCKNGHRALDLTTWTVGDFGRLVAFRM